MTRTLSVCRVATVRCVPVSSIERSALSAAVSQYCCEFWNMGMFNRILYASHEMYEPERAIKNQILSLCEWRFTHLPAGARHSGARKGKGPGVLQ